ncbi:MAG: MFS transporter [Marinomonas sp.]|nr:MAG: MFS transporter [Marinomonas sp.]
MLDILKHRTYRHLFSAQVVALIGTGLATIALSMLAFELAEGQAGIVLGTALTIKMATYVFFAPIATAYIRHLSRRTVLVALDIARASVALALPFVSEVWHVYVLIFILQTASASFTPLFQATIPDVLTEEKDYNKALSLSRLAYDLENLLSPALAGVLLTAITWHGLFTGTVVGFAASALLILTIRLPQTTTQPAAKLGFYHKALRGMRFYLATPRLRGLLTLNIVVTCAGAMVIINTVVLVQSQFSLSPSDTALALASFGFGSMSAALSTPYLLSRFHDRTLMLCAALLLVLGLLCGSLVQTYSLLLPIWFVLGIGYAFVQTPSGRLLARSAHSEDRPDLYAAQFSLSHACWLIAYPCAGWLGANLDMQSVFIIFAVVALLSILIALRIWPKNDISELHHSHVNLPHDHPHLAQGNTQHSHTFIIDDLHSRWPK